MDLADLKGRRLKISEVKQLLTDKRWIQDKTLTKFFGEAKTYVHPDNDYVLSVDWNDKGGMLFSNKAAVYRLVADPNVLKPKHVLHGIFNYGKDFPAQSKALAEIFFKETLSQLTEPIAPYSTGSLDDIDKYISAHGAGDLLQPRSFGGLLAYIGESLRNHHSMKWKMIRVHDDLWEPWLVDKEGFEYPVFAAVYKELYEYRPGYSSVRGAVLGEIQRNKLRKK